MTKNTCYSLPKDSKAWQQALDSVAALLPEHIDSQDLPALQSLPIFALIVVLPNTLASAAAQGDPDATAATTKTAGSQDIEQYIYNWVNEQPSWQLVPVIDDQDATYLQLSDVHPTAAQSHEDSQSAAKSAVNESLITPTESIKPIAEVSVLRYLLIPTTATLMHPEKKTAAAHIIDEQLTSRLRQRLAEQHATEERSQQALVDCHILSIGHMLRQHKLVCFDMDSTLIEQEVINELAAAAGIGDDVARITESAMRGEIDFDESFAQRLHLLAGLPTDVLDTICTQLSFSQGSHLTIEALKALGYHTVLLSGGFTYFARYVAEQLGIDEVHANTLDIDEDEVTGQVQLPIVNGERKAMLTRKIAEHLGIDMTQVVCVGDGANDLSMMAAADLGIAYRAKPIVQARADAAVNVSGLEGVLYALGYPALLPKR